MLALLTLAIPSLAQTAPSLAPLPVTDRRAYQALDAMPLIFEANEGQHDPRASFVSRTPEYTLYLTDQNATIVHASHKKNGRASAVCMEWLNASPAASAEGDARIAGNSNYFIGQDPSHWRSSVPNYQRVKLNHLYPGVDLVYYGNHDQLEYDLTVAPGADPGVIRLHIDGAKHVRLDKATGDVIVRDAVGSEMRLRKPLVYQGPANQKTEHAVAGHYILSERNTVSFAVGAYDHARPLVIDPNVVYSTVFGGSVTSGSYASNLLTGMAVGSSGFVYLHGITNFTNLPTTYGAFQPACNEASATQCSNFFVAKFDTTKSGAASLVYATYIGGSETKIGTGEQNAIYTQANSLALDSSGDAYITGYSSTYNYPTTSNAYSTTCGWSGSISCYGGVLTELNPSGTGLLYSTYFPTSTAGGNLGVTEPVMIAVDSSQVAYIAGLSSPGLISTDGSADNAGGNAPFIAAFDTTKSGAASLVYSEYLSLNQDYPVIAIAADPSGNAYLIGDLWPANNPAAGLTSAPITLNGFQTTTGNSAGIGPVLLRLSHAGAITYATYVGSSNSSTGDYHLSALSVDSSGDAYVGGDIATPAPIMNGLTATASNTAGAYIAKVNTNVSGAASLLYATFLTANSNNASYVTALANNGAGLVGFVGGDQSTTGTGNISTIEVNPLKQAVASSTGSYLQFAGIVDTTKTGDSALTFLSYVDGVQDGGQLTAISFDPSSTSNLIIGGQADIGNAQDPFLSVPASFATTEGNTDNPPFFYKISLTSPSALTVSPTALAFANQMLNSTSASQAVTVTNTGTTAITFSSIAASAQFTETDNCGTSLAVSSSCTINVTFTPTAIGAQTGSLTLTDSDPSSPQTIALTGTGINGTPQAALSPATVSFGNEPISTTSSAQVVVLSNTGTAPLSITSVSITGTNPSDFAETSACGSSLAAGSSCNISVNFTPASATSFSASLSVANNAANSPQTASLTGTGTAPQATLAPSSLSFNNQATGSTSTAQNVTLSNPGTAPLSITSIAFSGGTVATFSETNNCGASLGAGASCTIAVTFTPTAIGAASTTLTVTDSVAGPQIVAISGTGVAPPAPVAALTPSSLAFATTNVSSTAATQTLTLTNSGNAPLLLGGISIGGSNASSFAQTNNCGTSVAAGGSCTITVSFTPTAAGALSATLSVADNASTSPQGASLAGTGLASDFSLSPSPAAQTVNAGSNGTFTLNVAAISGILSSPVALSARGIPSATITFSPASITPGNASGSSVMTVQTNSAMALLRGPTSDAGHMLVALLAPLLFLRRRTLKRLPVRSRLVAVALFALLSAAGASLLGCGGGFTLPSRTYAITVTASSATNIHTATVNLTVQ